MKTYTALLGVLGMSRLLGEFWQFLIVPAAVLLISALIVVPWSVIEHWKIEQRRKRMAAADKEGKPGRMPGTLDGIPDHSQAPLCIHHRPQNVRCPECDEWLHAHLSRDVQNPRRA